MTLTTAKKPPSETRTIPEVWAPPSRASPTPPAQVRSKLSDADITTILTLSSWGVSGRTIAKRHLTHLSHTTVSSVVSWKGRPPTKNGMLQIARSNHNPITEAPQQERSLGTEIENYQPALRSSFNSGLGSVTPPNVINRAIKENNDLKGFIDFMQKRFELKNLLNEKALDPIANKFREQLKKRVMSLGFDASSDNDLQFGELNDMAACGLAVIKMLGARAAKLKFPQLVDACILYRRPDWRRRLEDSNRQLRCIRCKKLRTFIRSKDNKSVTCISCGLDMPLERARFRVCVRKLDPEYVDLVHSVVTSKSFGLGVEPGPLTSPRQARNHNLERCENVPSSQSSE